jgi:hypothetical protein
MIIHQLGYSNCMQSLHLTQGPEQHTAGELLALYETDQEDFIRQNVIGVRQFH